jgi:hypothetical protein
VSALYTMACASEVPDADLDQAARWASDALDLAEAGHIAESRADIVAELRSELLKVAGPDEPRSHWTGGWKPA